MPPPREHPRGRTRNPQVMVETDGRTTATSPIQTHHDRCCAITWTRMGDRIAESYRITRSFALCHNATTIKIRWARQNRDISAVLNEPGRGSASLPNSDKTDASPGFSGLSRAQWGADRSLRCEDRPPADHKELALRTPDTDVREGEIKVLRAPRSSHQHRLRSLSPFGGHGADQVFRQRNSHRARPLTFQPLPKSRRHQAQ